jgi:transposase-like protein
MTAQTTAPSPSAPAASVLVIVEGPDDKNILSEIFNRKNISGIRIIESEGIGKIPQIIRHEYRNHDRILVVIDSDRDSPEVKAKDMYHKIWEVLNSEGFSEKLSTNLFYRLESRDGGLLDIMIYPISPKDYDLSTLCDGSLNHLFQSWPFELMSLLFPAIYNQSTLEYLINQGVLSSNKTIKSLIYSKFCEIMNLLCQQNLPWCPLTTVSTGPIIVDEYRARRFPMGRKKQIDTSMYFCPHTDCPNYGKVGPDNQIVGAGRYGKANTQLLRCKVCGRTFSARRGTPLFGLKASEETFYDVIACLAEGNGIRATARIKGVDKDTVAEWLDTASKHVEAVSRYLMVNLHFEEAQLDEFWSFVQKKRRAVPLLNGSRPNMATVGSG